MDTLIALTIENVGTIDAPPGIPSGEQFTLGVLATAGISVMTILGIFLSLGYLVYGGFHWIQSRGDKETLDKSRRIILFSIIGLIIMALSLVIVNLVASAIGIDTTALFEEGQ